MQIKKLSESMLLQLAEKFGRSLAGGEVIELIGDVGSGKTTFTRGLARGLGIKDDIQSPTFTISRIYGAANDLRLAHYDFYRLTDAGIMSLDIEETLHDSKTVTVVEWGSIISGVLPQERVTISISTNSESERDIDLQAFGEHEVQLVARLA